VPEAFPTDWQSMLVLMPHPDDPEYGMASAVAKWTAQGRTVRYAMACRGEAGIQGMSHDETAAVREAEQRRAAEIVGVADVDFWDFPDSEIRNEDALRAKIAETVNAIRPDVVVAIYGGPEWSPGAPNQRDHIEFSAAVCAAYDEMSPRPRLFIHGPEVTHIETVDGYLDIAVDSLAAHDTYLSVLDPQTSVAEQARRQVDWATEFKGRRIVTFALRSTA
jgi:LmbE family N-acetylglucosaminyl deacetylase